MKNEELPRRIRMDKWSTAEHYIQTAVDEVEKMGADVILTNAVCKLSEARGLVADYIDGKIALERSSLRGKLIKKIIKRTINEHVSPELTLALLKERIEDNLKFLTTITGFTTEYGVTLGQVNFESEDGTTKVVEFTLKSAIR